MGLFYMRKLKISFKRPPARVLRILREDEVGLDYLGS
jgi:hypothetical protein